MKIWICVFFLCCCISTSGVAAADGAWGGMAGKRYVLKKVDGVEITFEKEIFLQISADGMVSGTVCNNFRGQGTLDNGILTLSQAASTRRMCINAGLSELEGRVLAMLTAGVAVIETRDGLELRRDGTILVFAVAS